MNPEEAEVPENSTKALDEIKLENMKKLKIKDENQSRKREAEEEEKENR